ncbi:CinA family protein [Pseudonocardia kunmingensis]|uniref:Nicotinamide-nucleotide amidase n=1 Tax=Pseudonocardia kunmingensis TaxID=630975 RepID=A0A543DAA8_9PSEU|nr:CinA family protein [Pseudonocardia kunmingensis]TQM06262.1 nicotinamide-nucleotide amidase [Pseudonocardia kunmingensis]
MTPRPIGYEGVVQPERTTDEPTIDQERARPADERHEEHAARVSELARRHGLTVAAAESLTGGNIAVALAAAEAAGEWFRGSLVAYSSDVKHEVLDVPDGPVVCAEAAEAMARGVRRLLGADVAVGVTGAGGPDPQDGQDPGTVFVAVDDGVRPHVRRFDLRGDPQEVLVAAAGETLALLVQRLEDRD